MENTGSTKEMIFDNVARLTIKGGGNVTINASGVIETNNNLAKFSQKLSTLTIEFPGTSSIGGMVFNNGSIISNGSYSSITSVSGYNGSSNKTEFTDMNGNRFMVDGDKVYLNGKLMVPAISTNEIKEDIPKTVYRLSQSKIGYISIVGSATLVYIDPTFINTDDLELEISGNGDIKLPFGLKLNRIYCLVSGSGDIFCNDCQVKKGTFKVSGSGDIDAFHIIDSGCVSISGSGDVTGTKSSGAKVDKCISGSGDISIRTK